MAGSNWKEYFRFTKSERIAIYLLITAILLVGLSNLLFPLFTTGKKADFSGIKQAIEKLKSEKNARFQDTSGMDIFELETVKSNFFYFDPNSASGIELAKLGINKYVVKNILRYREKGGKFRKKEDLRKMYGFDQALYQKLEPYIVINDYPAKKKDQPALSDKKEEVISQVDVNTATAEDFIKLKGIGPVLAERIIKFRDNLGGFYSVNQIGEVYGIDSLKFHQIRPLLVINEMKIKKLALNQSNIDQLSAHPYISYPMAKGIFNHRVKNGTYKSVNELLDKRILTDTALFHKLLPYLSLWEE